VIDWWIPITLFAALAQAVRFGLQKQLKSTKLSSVGATFARFLYSAPLVAVLAAVYAKTSGQGWPAVNSSFWVYAVVGGVAQVLATVCVVSLFSLRHFAVGIALKKTEVILSVIVGLIVLQESVTVYGLVAIVLSILAVFLLSDPPKADGSWYRRVVNRGTGLGLAAGMLFAISAVTYRGATLSLPFGDAFLRGSVTLAYVTAYQLLIMLGWLVWRDRPEVWRVVRAWRVAGLVGLFSMLGSLGWFTAFALQTAAYVKALGQVELAFVVLGGWLFFGERLSLRESLGLSVMVFSVVLLVAFA